MQSRDWGWLGLAGAGQHTPSALPPGMAKQDYSTATGQDTVYLTRSLATRMPNREVGLEQLSMRDNRPCPHATGSPPLAPVVLSLTRELASGKRINVDHAQTTESTHTPALAFQEAQWALCHTHGEVVVCTLWRSRKQIWA